MLLRGSLLALGLVLSVASHGYAQITGNVKNPTSGVFDHTDYNITNMYTVGFFAAGATAPVYTVNVPKAEITVLPGQGPPSDLGAPTSAYSLRIPRPAIGAYTMKLQACALIPGQTTDMLCSDWSTPSPGFQIVPFSPVNLR